MLATQFALLPGLCFLDCAKRVVDPFGVDVRLQPVDNRLLSRRSEFAELRRRNSRSTITMNISATVAVAAIAPLSAEPVTE
jgi:hypothetical protein